MPDVGQTLSHYAVIEKLGEGGPLVRGRLKARELRRGLAEANLRSGRP